MLVHLALGSNIGNRDYYINKAIEYIDKYIGRVIKKSKIIETEPYGELDQDKFLNLVIIVDTALNPYEILNKAKYIEKKLDRKKTYRWGPRTIDIDIIFYGNLILDEEELHIPHIDFMNREFVILPLLEIDKNKVDPRTDMTIEEIYKKITLYD